MFDYASYAKSLREEIHMYPEIGFDLPKTLAVVRRELDKMGIPYTDKFGKSSIVATIHEEKSHFTIGLRGDMDALPLQEDVDVPFKSRHDGIMHACGHDAHTAILLATAKWLWDHKDEINCRVKLLFTPAEEYIEPGCKQMAENGVMDDIDCAIALHVDTAVTVGQVAINDGDLGANSMGFQCRFYGSAAHAASQEKGKDAIMMAVQAINAMEIMAAKELKPNEPRLLNIGSIHGGTTNNIICDYVEIFGSCRTHSDEVSAYMENRLRQITEGTAAMAGGRGEFEVVKFLPYRVNHPVVIAKVREAAKAVLGAENVTEKPRRTLGGEDFGFLSRKKPCAFIMLGIRPEGVTSMPAAHSSKFYIDESCFSPGIGVMTRFVMDNMNGIEF